eukprot:g17424.t1
MRRMNRLGVVAALAAGLGLSGMAVAMDSTGPQVDRDLMMEQVGEATGLLAAMARGEAEYDPRVAVLAMRTYVSVAAAFPYMFPEGTETGNDTRAAAAIWSDPDGFVAAANKFEADATAALATAGDGVEAFQAAFGAVAQNCRACHESYRTARN